MGIIRKSSGRTVNPYGDAGKVVIFDIATLAAATDAEYPLVYALEDLYISSAYIVNQATVAANATNYRIVGLRDKGSDGTGTTAASTLVDTTTVALTAFVGRSLSATNGYKVAKGNVLAINFTHGGTGAALTNAIVVVRFK